MPDKSLAGGVLASEAWSVVVSTGVGVLRGHWSALGVCLLSTAASAAFTMSDPGRYASQTYTTLLEARARLDNGTGQSWKTAIWGSGTSAPAATSGNYTSDWVSGQSYQFQFDYNVTTGLATWWINNRTVQTTLALAGGKGLAALQFEARSRSGSFAVSMESLQLAVDGGAYSSPAGLGSIQASGATFVNSGRVYLTQDIRALSARGSIKFEFQGGSANGDNMRAAVRLFEANLAPQALIPAPGVVALGVLSMIAALHRGRPRR